MSIDLKPGWLSRQFTDLETPYSEAEFEALQWPDRKGDGPHPSIYKLRATVDRLYAALKVAREAIEKAPHYSACGWMGNAKSPHAGVWVSNLHPVDADCNCWIREALSAINAALSLTPHE